MNQTIAQLLDHRTQRASIPDRWAGEIISVDYLAREIVVRIAGNSAVRVAPRHDLNLGSAANPKVIPGGTLQVERIGDRYAGTVYLPLIGVSQAYATPTPTLGTPVWNTGYPRIRGSNIEGAWGVVTGATRYEVWRNTTPSANGAEWFGTFVSNTFAQTYASGATSQLLTNCGFESGDFTGWESADVGMPPIASSVVSAAHPRTGNYSHAGVEGSGTRPSAGISSSAVRIIAGKSYVMSAYVMTLDPARNYNFSLRAYWYDANMSFLTASDVFGTGLTTNYQKWTAVATAPANAAYARIAFAFLGNVQIPLPGTEQVYLDDCSLIGESGNAATVYSYAIRALDDNGNASAFSTWLTPAATSAQLGAASIELDFENSRIQSSNFVSGTSGFRLDDNGIDGKLLSGGGGIPTNLIAYTTDASAPSGWTEYTAARGRYIVGLPSGGTAAGTVGTALSNLENRAVGQHTHSVSDPGHGHNISDPGHNHAVTVSQGSGGGPTYGAGNDTWIYPTSYSTNTKTTGIGINSATTGISISNQGSVAGTNAPYIQLLVIKKT